MRNSAPDGLVDPNVLRKRIIESLCDQGFVIKDGEICPPETVSKEELRTLHRMAVQHKIGKASKGLQRYERTLLKRIADGRDLDPAGISPRLIQVERGSEDELLFRYATLHWSIPVSSGYGRRLRFIVVDENNGKLIGVIGLGDPVFNLRPRDEWIGWSMTDRRSRLRNVMDAFVLGAVPPYSFLLCGKLIALLASSAEVHDEFKRKYAGRKSVISEEDHDGLLASICTTSALGRSSIYNRLKVRGRLVYHSVGYTEGSGEFHFSNGIYADMRRYVERECIASAKHKAWGSGFRNRREVVKKCLASLGLSWNLIYHGVKREVFVIPLAENTREFLRGEEAQLFFYDTSARELFAFFRERWLLPRAARDQSYLSFKSQSWKIWK